MWFECKLWHLRQELLVSSVTEFRSSLNDMLRYAVLILAVVVAISGPTFPADSDVRQIEIKSSWGGLGRPQSTELAVRHDNGEYRIGSTRIDPANVESLLASIRQPPQT